MDIDPNDLLATNVYISKPELRPNVSGENNEEFKKYYEKELQRQSESKIIASINKIELKNTNHSESNDDNNIINTNAFNSQRTTSDEKSVSRVLRETKTLVSVDSRDRQKSLYLKPNNFKIFLGKTFTNVKKIELVSLEFPNTDAVINTGNNKIYWRNKEDIDLDFTVTTKGVINYPVYSVELRVGSYTSATLQSEIQTKLNSVRRKQGISNGSSIIGDYHYFVVNLDVDTDITSLTSLTLKQLSNNPLTASLGSGVIEVYAPNHGFSTYDYVYILSPKAIAGIGATTLVGFHQITVTGDNKFTFEVATKAADTTTGGGNTIKVGKKAPFELLWGENSYTVAQNIGYPIENSSQLIKTYITSLQNLYQMTITTINPHGFSRNYTYIGQLIAVGYIDNNNFVSRHTYEIMDIPNTTTILVQVTDNTVADSLNSEIIPLTVIQFLSKTYNITTFQSYYVSSILITTQTEHNYILDNIGDTLTLSDTIDPSTPNDTNYDGNYSLMAVPSSTRLVIPGILNNINTHTSGIYGCLSRKNPLTTWTVKIKTIIKNYIKDGDSYYTKIDTDVPHKLNKGDSVTLNNIKSSPVITRPQTITNILSSNSFLIKLQLDAVDTESINQGLAYIGTGLVTVSFPSHGFNQIVGVANGVSDIYTYTVPGSLTPTTVTTLPIIVTTLMPHNLSIGSKIRLSGTNTSPSLDGGGYIVLDIHDSSTFSIYRSSTTFTNLTIPTGITGIIGLSNEFYLYDCESIGGLLKVDLNSTKFNVRDIIDINTFTFITQNSYATSSIQGGGTNVYISSLLHGFNGVQTNTKNNILNRAINLQGEDYCFITCPQLNTMLNTGSVSNIFARISLDQPPGYVCFKYLSNPKHFNIVPLDTLSELEFSIVNYNSSLYEFNDLDFSFTLEITEVADATKSFNVSSKRGITDSS